MSDIRSQYIMYINTLITQETDGAVIAACIDRASSIIHGTIQHEAAEPGGHAFTLVLDYHPCLYTAHIQQACNSICSKYFLEFRRLFGCPGNIRVAWKNGIAPVHAYLRSL